MRKWLIFLVLCITTHFALNVYKLSEQTAQRETKGIVKDRGLQDYEGPRKNLEPAPPPLRATVGIYEEISTDPPEMDWAGSGVFVAPNYIITAAHVLLREEENPPPQIMPPIAPIRKQIIPKVGERVIYRHVGIGDPKFRTATIAFIDIPADLALLQVNNEQEYSSYFYPVDFTIPDLGERVTLVTLMEEQAVLMPFTVANNRHKIPWNATDDTTKDVEQEMILLFPSTHPGSSGGGIINESGRLVAVVVGMFRPTHAYAMPLRQVRKNLAKFGLACIQN